MINNKHCHVCDNEAEGEVDVSKHVVVWNVTGDTEIMSTFRRLCVLETFLA